MEHGPSLLFTSCQPQLIPSLLWLLVAVDIHKRAATVDASNWACFSATILTVLLAPISTVHIKFLLKIKIGMILASWEHIFVRLARKAIQAMLVQR